MVPVHDFIVLGDKYEGVHLWFRWLALVPVYERECLCNIEIEAVLSIRPLFRRDPVTFTDPGTLCTVVAVVFASLE